MLLTRNGSKVVRWYRVQNLNSKCFLASLSLILCTFLVEKDYTRGFKLFTECTLLVGVPNKPPSSVTISTKAVRGLNDMKDGKMRTRNLGTECGKCKYDVSESSRHSN